MTTVQQPTKDVTIIYQQNEATEGVGEEALFVNSTRPEYGCITQEDRDVILNYSNVKALIKALQDIEGKHAELFGVDTTGMAFPFTVDTVTHDNSVYDAETRVGNVEDLARIITKVVPEMDVTADGKWLCYRGYFETSIKLNNAVSLRFSRQDLVT